jgi:hypothetical protein
MLFCKGLGVGTTTKKQKRFLLLSVRSMDCMDETL